MKISRFNSKLFFIPMVAATIFFTSCKDKDATEEVVPATAQEATLEQKKQALENVVPGSNTTTSTNTGGALNPAHGQPGHRCDIPVGAPLGGDSGNTNTPPAIKATNTMPVSTGSGINPPTASRGTSVRLKWAIHYNIFFG